MIVYLGIGSNIEPDKNVAQACQALQQKFPQCRFSRVFESEAVGFDGDNFHNLVAEIDTELSLDDLISWLKHLEAELGRRRGVEKFSSRVIDIDILLYGDLVAEEPIVLPRPEIRDNAYVLWPLSELAPDLVEPGGNFTYGQLWRAFDQDKQKLYPLAP